MLYAYVTVLAGKRIRALQGSRLGGLPLRGVGDVPNLVNEFLKAWGYSLAHPEFQSNSLQIDCGMRFESVVPASWIDRVESISEEAEQAAR